MKRGIALIILGIVIIVGLFVIDGVASKQVFGAPYTYEQGEQHAVEIWATFYPDRAKGWVKEYYNIHQILWGVGLPLSAILIGLGFWVKGMNKPKNN